MARRRLSAAHKRAISDSLRGNKNGAGNAGKRRGPVLQAEQKAKRLQGLSSAQKRRVAIGLVTPEVVRSVNSTTRYNNALAASNAAARKANKGVKDPALRQKVRPERQPDMNVAMYMMMSGRNVRGQRVPETRDVVSGNYAKREARLLEGRRVAR